MGRTIIVEELLENLISSFFGTKKLQVGLLIGQFTDARDYIVHMAQAPDPVENEAEVENTEEEMMLQGDTMEEAKIVKKEPSQKSINQNTDDFDENWIIEHARQVNRMLPGGLCIAGIYIFSAPEFMNKNQSKLRHCLQKVHKQLEKIKFLRLAIPHNERVFLHICSASKKITCRTLDVRDSQGSLKPCEMKYQSFLHKWHTLKCVSNLDVQVSVPQSAEKSNYEAQIQLSLHDHLEQVWNSIALVNKEIIGEDDYLYNPAKGSKAKKDEGKTFDVELFTPCVSPSPEMTQNKSIGVVSLHGKIVSRSFVHNRATKGTVAKAVKMDLIRSILSRVELLCEEAEINCLYQVDSWSLISPTRIFAPMPRGPVQFCDYAFKDERLKDSLDRFSELLSLNLEEENLHCMEKSPASDHQLSSCGDETDTRSQVSAESMEIIEKQGVINKSIGCTMAIIMVVIAVLAALLLQRL